MMKLTCSILELVAAAVLLLATGCSKKESPATATSTQSTTPPVSTPATGAISPANTNAALQALAPAVRQPTTTPPAASTNATAATPAATPQIQPVSLAQTATNEARALAAAATNALLGALANTNQAAFTTNQVQALLDHAKALTANQKYQDALATLTELYNTKLTPEQKQKADDLKVQIESAMAQKAASSLGNILGGQKK